MNIQKLQIKDFKCFTEYELEPAPETTIIIGRNGAGKTSILQAFKIGLSFIFANDKSLGNDFLSAGNPSLKVISYEPGDYRLDTATRTYAPSANIHGEAQYGEKKLSWDMYKRSVAGAALYSSRYKIAFQTFMNAWKNEGEELPLLAYYSDSFPHKDVKETKYALDIIQQEYMPRNFGYYQWDMEAACVSIWEIRLSNKLAQRMPLYTPAMRLAVKLQELENQYSKEELEVNEEYLSARADMERIQKNMEPLAKETDYITGRLQKFISGLPALKGEGYEIDYLIPNQTEQGYQLTIVFKNGKIEQFQHLPAGYRRLYAMVLDIAYRAYILNGEKESAGIIMIDEIDLHLHPSLEQCVVQSLRDTFPRIQFIMSTHSVAVISNLNTAETDERGNFLNKILIMQEGQTQAEVLPNIYGIDYTAALRDFMDTPSRNLEIRKKMDEYLTYYALGLEKEAESILNEIKKIVGTDVHPVLEELDRKKRNYEIYR